MKPSPEQRASRGNAGPQALAVLRAAWGCDCDGVSHGAGGHAPAGPSATVERHLDVIEGVTGQRPPTCPWRAFYDPLVSTALDLSVDADGGYVMATLGDDPPPVLVEALRIFRIARAAGQRHVRKFTERKNAPKGPSAGPSSGGFVSMKRPRRARIRRG